MKRLILGLLLSATLGAQAAPQKGTTAGAVLTSPLRVRSLQVPQPAGVFLAPSSAAAPAAPAAVNDRLLEALRQRVRPGSPDSAETLDATLKTLMISPTARRLAQEFIDGRGLSVVTFKTLENPLTDAHVVISGRYAAVSFDDSRRLTPSQQDARPLAGSLAHELLGHAVGAFGAAPIGGFEAYNGYYRGNEARASLVGWIAEAEMGVAPRNARIWQYLRDPEEYHRNLHLIAPYYAATFSPVEMSDPVAVLRERLGRVQSQTGVLDREAASYESWRAAIDNLVTRGGMSREAFAGASGTIRSKLDTNIPNRRRAQAAIADSLQKWIDWYSTAAGLAAAKRLSTTLSSSYFAREEANLAGLRDRLAGLVRGRSVKPETAAAGQVTWEELRNLVDQDAREHPERWKKP